MEATGYVAEQDAVRARNCEHPATGETPVVSVSRRDGGSPYGREKEKKGFFQLLAEEREV